MAFSSRRRDMLLVALLGAAPQVRSQPARFPDRPLRIVVGYAAGGGMDTMARILAAGLSGQLGQSVVVENRPGAAGMLAADHIAKSAADGYSLLMGETSLLIAPHLQASALVDPLAQLTPVAGLFESLYMVIANNDFPASNPAEMIQVLKAAPGKYVYATSGIGTLHHMGFELLKAEAGLTVLHVPYRGASQLVPDLLNNRIQLAVVSASVGQELAQAGKVKALGVYSNVDARRSGGIAPIATAVPGFDVVPLQVLYAPAGTPADVVARLSQAVRAVLADPGTVEQAGQQGVVPAYAAPQPLARKLASESARWRDLIEQQHIKAQ
ncbi:Bug family tripartite tricarboxylate transporter substrate binding protein [Bordetella petrii]|uniref:Bug family tripartite tricarboxylate transporter substrate binding protein n=1 Tax=Bordetella petrii TaxID=94624 RepID=UPI001A95E77E|nr:tripartite tricarboxylate transporter substrate binding protein [Bordetella petrii]MBO1110860.1 tripartite tricarboxylate transporter substrate binding protein [Bordetella petrii]